MSTICKLDPFVRQRRAARANLLRNPPPVPNGSMAQLAYFSILEFLKRAHRAPFLTGTQKHDIFVNYGRKLAQVQGK